VLRLSSELPSFFPMTHSSLTLTRRVSRRRRPSAARRVLFQG
jgi:hypothetical protein